MNGKNIELCPISIKHTKGLLKNWGSDPEVFKTLSSRRIDTIDLMMMFVGNSELAKRKDEYSRYTIIEKKTNSAIGILTVTPRDIENNKFEFGYGIGSKFWGKGYATEAMKIVIAHMENTIGNGSAIATVNTNNASSIKVLLKNGFEISDRQKRSEIYGEHCYSPSKECYLLKRELHEYSNDSENNLIA
jgi:ribosomal-protein-alanine N-acetyltransferase